MIVGNSCYNAENVENKRIMKIPLRKLFKIPFIILNSHPLQMSNQSMVLYRIARAFAEQLLSDICLIVGNNRYPAHRVILCASSEVFQVLNKFYFQGFFQKDLLEGTLNVDFILGHADESRVE